MTHTIKVDGVAFTTRESKHVAIAYAERLIAGWGQLEIKPIPCVSVVNECGGVEWEANNSITGGR